MHAVTMDSRKRGTSNGFCCDLGSIKLRPVALAATPKTGRCRDFSSLTGWSAGGQYGPIAVPGVLAPEIPKGSWHQGFRLASPSVRPASSGGTDLDWRAGMPERGTTGTKPSAPTMYGWNLPLASKGLAAATETSHFGGEWRQKWPDRQLPLTGAAANGVKRASRGTGFGGTSQNRNFGVYRRAGMRLGPF